MNWIANSTFAFAVKVQSFHPARSKKDSCILQVLAFCKQCILNDTSVLVANVSSLKIDVKVLNWITDVLIYQPTKTCMVNSMALRITILVCGTMRSIFISFSFSFIMSCLTSIKHWNSEETAIPAACRQEKKEEKLKTREVFLTKRCLYNFLTTLPDQLGSSRRRSSGWRHVDYSVSCWAIH